MALKVLSALETSKITVPIPSATTDAATKGYVDDNAGGGGGGSDLSAIVPAFSSSKTYAVGSFVSYNAKIYKCTTAVTTVGDFSSSNWTEVILTSNIESNSQVSYTKIQSDLLPGATTTMAGIVTLASNTGTATDKDKVPVLDTYGKLDSSVLPTSIVTSDKILPHNIQAFTTTMASSSDVYCDSGLSNNYLSKQGWYILIPSNRSPSQLIFEPTFNAEVGKCYTIEFVISCAGSAGSTFTFKIVDEDENDVVYLGDSITELERGYTYFVVGRCYRTYDQNGNTTMAWVFNLQGKVPLPS